jgi:hypothetical protein
MFNKIEIQRDLLNCGYIYKAGTNKWIPKDNGYPCINAQYIDTTKYRNIRYSPIQRIR